MFLLNLFSRSNTEKDDQKFDKITFKIDLNENVPKFQDWAQNQCYQQEQLTPNHPLYNEIFPKEQQKFVQYETTQNDTIMGIAMKLDLSEKTIQSMNNISGHIYPGMKIKLPQETDLSKLYLKPMQQTSKMKITQILKPVQKGKELVNYKYTVCYSAGPTGVIKGSLTINSNYLIYNPALDDEANVQKYTVQRLLKFNAIVETADIQDATYMQIPQMGQGQVPVKSIFVQFMLYRVGNTKIQKKYKQRLKQLKLDHKAIASMTFKILSTKEKQAADIGKDLVEKVKTIVKQLEQKQQQVQDSQEKLKNRLTNIPFFDIIHENIQPKVQEKQEKGETGMIINTNAVLGNLSEPSQILSPQQFSGLVKSMPVLYQLYSWTKIYGSSRDGTSFSTFLNRSKGVQPLVLLIKQHKGYKFGGFLIENIDLGKTGRGEMFIFTYRQTQLPQIYLWTGANQFFVYCEKQKGIGIGMGFKYGIFLKNDMDKGSSSSTDTFGNKTMLSKKQDFYVDQVQLWGIDMSY